MYDSENKKDRKDDLSEDKIDAETQNEGFGEYRPLSRFILDEKRTKGETDLFFEESVPEKDVVRPPHFSPKALKKLRRPISRQEPENRNSEDRPCRVDYPLFMSVKDTDLPIETVPSEYCPHETDVKIEKSLNMESKSQLLEKQEDKDIIISANDIHSDGISNNIDSSRELEDDLLVAIAGQSNAIEMLAEPSVETSIELDMPVSSTEIQIESSSDTNETPNGIEFPAEPVETSVELETSASSTEIQIESSSDSNETLNGIEFPAEPVETSVELETSASSNEIQIESSSDSNETLNGIEFPAESVETSVELETPVSSNEIQTESSSDTSETPNGIEFPAESVETSVELETPVSSNEIQTESSSDTSETPNGIEFPAESVETSVELETPVSSNEIQSESPSDRSETPNDNELSAESFETSIELETSVSSNEIQTESPSDRSETPNDNEFSAESFETSNELKTPVSSNEIQTEQVENVENTEYLPNVFNAQIFDAEVAYSKKNNSATNELFRTDVPNYQQTDSNELSESIQFTSISKNEIENEYEQRRTRHLDENEKSKNLKNRRSSERFQESRRMSMLAPRQIVVSEQETKQIPELTSFETPISDDNFLQHYPIFSRFLELTRHKARPETNDQPRLTLHIPNSDESNAIDCLENSVRRSKAETISEVLLSQSDKIVHTENRSGHIVKSLRTAELEKDLTGLKHLPTGPERTKENEEIHESRFFRLIRHLTGRQKKNLADFLESMEEDAT